jgi:hypothetical protein
MANQIDIACSLLPLSDAIGGSVIDMQRRGAGSAALDQYDEQRDDCDAERER